MKEFNLASSVATIWKQKDKNIDEYENNCADDGSKRNAQNGSNHQLVKISMN